ncbi:hypothetical protein BX600DRAFT_510662 [Xylariales sp. PMI_506]|nr:hypothetical protein BX600DRAFT_510662 [Xylariales sp. PMI_506]
MADPKLYLPGALSDEVIRKLLTEVQLPVPVEIKPLKTIAAYHTIYLITFSSTDSGSELGQLQPTEPDGSISLVLRVSGRHLPQIKTLNEVAAMKWVKAHTKIPIPEVVRFDASENNALGYEYTLMEKVPGVSVDTIYDTLDDGKKAYLISQITDYLIDLRHQECHHVGGLSLDEQGQVIPGRVLEETFWQTPEIAGIWGPDESVDTLNSLGPYVGYTGYVKGHIQQYIRNIELHQSLDWMRDLIPRLRRLNEYLDEHAEELDSTKYILTQRDMHFGNIMCDRETARITAVLDWEFAEVLPLALWSPGKAFLWNGQETAEGMAEQDALYEVFAKYCQERDPELLADFDVKTQHPHKSISRAMNYVRGIVEVCPRNQKAEAARSWRKTAEEALGELGL